MKLYVGAKGIIYNEGKVLLVREASSEKYVDGTEEGKWDVPGGRIEAGEPIREGLLREVMEEAGLEVTPLLLLDVIDGFPIIQGVDSHIVRVYFLCELTVDDEVTLSDDHDEYRWIEPDKVPEGMYIIEDVAKVIEKVSTLEL